MNTEVLLKTCILKIPFPGFFRFDGASQTTLDRRGEARIRVADTFSSLATTYFIIDIYEWLEKNALLAANPVYNMVPAAGSILGFGLRT